MAGVTHIEESYRIDIDPTTHERKLIGPQGNGRSVLKEESENDRYMGTP